MTLIPRTVAGFGWKPQLPDHRDLKFSLDTGATPNYPGAVDLRMTGHMPPVYDQGDLGSCTANTIAACYDYMNHDSEGTWITPSRLFIYYQERFLEDSVSQDNGAQLRDGMKVVNTIGVVSETEWPYDITQFATAPPQALVDEAKKELAVEYRAVTQDLDQLRMTLASGYPICFGFTVFQNFKTPQVSGTGVLGMPASTDAVLGGHAVLIVGYNMSDDTFLVRNSWGPDWGQQGYFTMPSAYVTNADLSGDFWTLVSTT